MLLLIEDIFKQAEEEAQVRIKNGKDVPGYMMSPGNSSKKWSISEEELVKKLKACKLKKDEIYISKLISPSQLMKHEGLTTIQKERILNDYIKIIPGKIKLKPINKKSAVDMFSDNVLQCNTGKQISFI